MDEWRKERDTLVSALEVQLKKLVSTIVEKDQQIMELKRTETLRPPEVTTAYFNIIVLLSVFAVLCTHDYFDSPSPQDFILNCNGLDCFGYN